MWVLVELETDVMYGEGGSSEYTTLGDEAYGPFATREEAEEHGKKVNENRGYYTYRGRKRRMNLRNFYPMRLTKEIQ